MAIPLVRPSIKRKDLDSVLTCLVSDQIASGVQNEEFVSEALEAFGLDGGLAFRDPGTAIRFGLQAIGIGVGSRVGLPVFAPRVYMQAVIGLGGVPIFIDSLPGTPVVDEEALGKLHEQEPLSCFISYGACGVTGNLEGVRELGLPILEDITTIVDGSYRGGVKVGSVGNFVLLRTEAEDLITSGGGMLLLSKGKKESKSLQKVTEGLPETVFMAEMNAALGKIQFKEIRKFMERRREFFSVFTQSVLRSHNQLLLNPNDEPVPSSFVVKVKGSLHEVQGFCLKKGIETRATFDDSCYHWMAATAEGDDREEIPRAYPNCGQLMLQCLSFPLYPSLGGKEVETLLKVLAALP